MINFLKNVLRILLNQKVPKVNNDFLHILLSRKSCRNFSEKEVTTEDIEKILLAGVSAPSTVNLQTWSFFPFLYNDWKKTFSTPIPFGARAAIIIAADLKRLELIDNTFKSFPLFFYTIAVMNASLAAMNMAIAVEAMGMKSIMLSQTGKTGLVDISYLKNKLKLPDKVIPLMTLAFGYPKSEILFSPPKLSKDVVIHSSNYHLEIEKVKDWFNQMETASLVADREKITEKFSKYVKLLPEAEQELWDEFEKIKS